MYTINLFGAGKKFNKEWIFKDVSFALEKGDVLGITGSNGSGKSTLLQLIAGYSTPTKGKVFWHNKDSLIPRDEVYRYLAFCSPYMQLIETFTLHEMIQFYITHKKMVKEFDALKLIALAEMEAHRNKLIKDFSSGMKQRVKLLLAIATHTPFLFLDEPCANLDKHVVSWYQQFLTTFAEDRIIVICSNQSDEELFLCNKFISIEKFKN